MMPTKPPRPPKQQPPPQIDPKPVADEPQPTEREREELATAALISLAGTAQTLADQTGDARIGRVAAAALKEITAGGDVGTLVKMVARATSKDDEPDRREEERQQRQAEWQQSLMRRREAVDQTRQTQRELMSVLLKKLDPEKTPWTTNQSSSSDG